MRMWGAGNRLAKRALVAGFAAYIVLGASTYANASPSWGWPLAAPHILVKPFQPPAKKWLAGHRGVDLQARAGQNVLAAGSGTVEFAGMLAGKPVVVINHGVLRTTYEPVRATVFVGSRIVTGEVIGFLSPGASHCSPGGVVRCLHWGLIRGSTYLNPLALVHHRIRLLPLGH